MRFGGYIDHEGQAKRVRRIEFCDPPHVIFALEGDYRAILHHLNVREEHERVKRPPILDKDGKPIEVGETLYGEDGKAWDVKALHWGKRYPVEAHRAPGDGAGPLVSKRLKSEWLTHERPDTWARLEEMAREIDSELTAFKDYRVSSASILVSRAKALSGVAE